MPLASLGGEDFTKTELLSRFGTYPRMEKLISNGTKYTSRLSTFFPPFLFMEVNCSQNPLRFQHYSY